MATLASTARFPQRELGLWTSNSSSLSPAQVHVEENGQPVSGLSLTPLSKVGNGGFGVVVVIDESSITSTNTRGLELATAEAIAAKRAGNQQFGLITFAARPTVMVPLTSNPGLIKQILATQPLVAPGESVLPALSRAYSELERAGVATGAVILVTAGRNLASPAAEAAVSQGGLKLGFQTFTTDVLAAPSSTGSSSGNGGDSDAAQEKAVGAQLNGAADIWSNLTSGYLASYRSAASPGQQVTVSVSADGTVGTPTMQYIATRPPAPPALKLPPAAALSQLPALSSRPGFARFVPIAAPANLPAASATFWSSPASMALVAACCALLLGGALWLLLGGVGRSEVEGRVAKFIPAPGTIDAPDVLASAPGVPGILARRRWWPGFALWVDVGRFRRSPVALVKWAVAGSLVAAVLFTLLLGSVAGALLGLPVGPVVLYVVLRRAVRRNRSRFFDQLPATLQDMAGAVRGGRSLAGALAAAMDGADQPILSEFERAVADEQLGRPLEGSLHTIAERMQSQDMDQVALVAALHRRSGSGVAEALDHVAEGARERAELIRELNSLTGQARLSSRILTGLPVVLFVALSLLEPGYMEPLTHTAGGIAVSILCAFMVFLGWLSMRRIVKIEA